jgi:hypothetical protein
MKADMEIIRPGATVTIGDEIEALVTQVCIRECDHVSYQCVWWDGNNRKTQWLEECEVDAHQVSHAMIGFRVDQSY